MAGLLSALSQSSRVIVQTVFRLDAGLRPVPSGRLVRLASLLSLFSRSDEASETLLAEKFSELRIHGDLSEYESRALDRLAQLMNLRALTFGKLASGRQWLRQGFLVRAPRDVFFEADRQTGFAFTLGDITESATAVTALYWKLFETCMGDIPELRTVALQLYYSIFAVPFREEHAKARLSVLCNAIQEEAGVPFLVLNLLQQRRLSEAREVGRFLAMEGIELESEELATTLYWLAEIFWFQRAWATERLTHETSLRFLYHLCFASPERAGFLEIDSQFFAEFEVVNELAREAFAYRETLVENLLELWRKFDGDFDSIFQKVLESVAGSTESLWRRSHDAFSRDYLCVVEGNLSYAAGQFKEAAESYETALVLNPELRPALLNLLFAYAKQGRRRDHEDHVLRVHRMRHLQPSALYAIADSYLLLGDEPKARIYYEELRHLPGWDGKVEYYQSTFCFQNRLFDAALQHAQVACEKNPNDSSMLYHLSLCYNAVGSKDEALAALRNLGPGVQSGWLHFYRFTLERDLGNHDEASETLLKIPSDYFEDPEELQAALDYARARRDIGLMRHLRTKRPR